MKTHRLQGKLNRCGMLFKENLFITQHGSTMLCLLLGSACWCVNHFDKGAPILRVYVELKHGTCDVQPDTQWDVKTMLS